MFKNCLFVFFLPILACLKKQGKLGVNSLLGSFGALIGSEIFGGLLEFFAFVMRHDSYKCQSMSTVYGARQLAVDLSFLGVS